MKTEWRNKYFKKGGGDILGKGGASEKRAMTHLQAMCESL